MCVPRNPLLFSLPIGQEGEQLCQWGERSDSQGTGHRGWLFTSIVWESSHREESRAPLGRRLWAQPPWHKWGALPAGLLSPQPRACARVVTGIQLFLLCHREELRDAGIGKSGADIQVKSTHVKPHLLWCKCKNKDSVESHAFRLCPAKKVIFSSNLTLITANHLNKTGWDLNGYKVLLRHFLCLWPQSGHWTPLSFHVSKYRRWHFSIHVKIWQTAVINECLKLQ